VALHCDPHRIMKTQLGQKIFLRGHKRLPFS
jgi:hypothetical protein